MQFSNQIVIIFVTSPLPWPCPTQTSSSVVTFSSSSIINSTAPPITINDTANSINATNANKNILNNYKGISLDNTNTTSNNTSNIMTNLDPLDLSSPRPLTPHELTTLTALLKSHLRLHNTSCPFTAEADATDLLTYATDMIDDGESVAQVLEELAFMEMEICDEDVLESVRISLVDFLKEVSEVEGRGAKKDLRVDNYLMRDRSSGGGGGGDGGGDADGDGGSRKGSSSDGREDLVREAMQSKGQSTCQSDESGEDDCKSSPRSRTQSMSAPPKKDWRANNYLLAGLEEDKRREEMRSSSSSSSSSDVNPANNPGARDANDTNRPSDTCGGSLSSSVNEQEKKPKNDWRSNNYLLAGLEEDEYRRKESNNTSTSDSNSSANNHSSSAQEEEEEEEEEEVVEYPKEYPKEEEAILPKKKKTDWRSNNYLIAGLEEDKRRERSYCTTSTSAGSTVITDDSGAHNSEGLNVKNGSSTNSSTNGPTSNQHQSHHDSEHSFENALLNSENHVSVDLSAKTAADKNNKELQNLFGSGGRCSNLKDRMTMYNERGELRKHVRRKSTDGHDGVECDAKSIDELRRQELMIVMNDRALTKYVRAGKMDEVRAKYDGVRRSADGSNNSNNDDTNNDNAFSSVVVGGVDLSAKAAAAKHAKEMASLFGSNNGNNKRCTALSLKDRMSMYNDRGEIIKYTNRNGSKDGEENEKGAKEEKSNDQLRREELMEVMRDRTLGKEEKAKKMEEVRRKYNGDAAAPTTGATTTSANVAVNASNSLSHSRPILYRRDSNQSIKSSGSGYHRHRDDESPPSVAPPMGGFDLSAKAAADKNRREMESLFGSGRNKSAKNRTMSSNRDSYTRQLVLDKPSMRERTVVTIGGTRNGARNTSGIPQRSGSDKSSSNGDTNVSDVGAPQTPSPPPSIDQQRRAELQKIMRDGSLKKDERRKKMEEIKEKYAAIAKEINRQVLEQKNMNGSDVSLLSTQSSNSSAVGCGSGGDNGGDGESN